MEKNLYIDASHPNETRVVLKSGENIEDYEYEGLKNNLIKNNIYLGKVSRIEPSLQAAFIDFGRERHGFSSFNDIQSDYYQIPKADLERIKEEEEKAREELSREVEAKEEENIAEGKLEIDDPIEKISEEQIEEDLNNKENITEKENLVNGKEKKKEHRFKFKRYKIQEVIKPNQVILVQVIKDERGQKGAALSTFISIAGKYIVLMPNTPKGGGISRKIFNSGERKKIRSILNEITIPKEINHKGLSENYSIPDSLNDLAEKGEKGFLALKIVEIIGEDEVNNLDPETIYFVTNLLNKMNLLTIRNKVLNSALPLRT